MNEWIEEKIERGETYRIDLAQSTVGINSTTLFDNVNIGKNFTLSGLREIA